VPGALLQALPPGCGARIKLDTWPRPPLFAVIQRMAGLDTEAALRQFGLGLGMLIFAPPFFGAAVVRKLARQRAHAWVIGEVTDNAGRVEVE
ncbi:MAG TPA: AIR synthase-related protein, partial [Candidatus Brocadiia bacterium]|nr:AIR synthase-related protein [Candidatus Brocadiia bacterium]